MDAMDPWGTTKISITRSFSGNSFCGGFAGTNSININVEEPSTTANYAYVVQRLTVGVTNVKCSKKGGCCTPGDTDLTRCDVFEVFTLIDISKKGQTVINDSWGYGVGPGNCGSSGLINFTGEVRVLESGNDPRGDARFRISSRPVKRCGDFNLFTDEGPDENPDGWSDSIATHSSFVLAVWDCCDKKNFHSLMSR